MRLLIIDDEIIYLKAIQNFFSENKLEAEIENNPISALVKINSNDYDIVISDYRMNNYNGIFLLKEIKKIKPECKVIIQSGFLSCDIIEEAKKSGAYSILLKNDRKLIEIINEIKKLEREKV